MQLDFLIKEEQKDLLDPLYNHKNICEVLVQSGAEAAIALFRRQSLVLKRLDRAHIDELRCIFLNSLNRCLYNYILFTWDISLSECCFENKALTHAFATEEDFLSAGANIIRRYNAGLDKRSANAVHIANALRYINEHLGEELSLSVVAHNIYISPCYLCKIFKPQTGQSFVGYVNRQRLLRAKKLLVSTDRRIDWIAMDCGFRNASYFSTLFRKETGISPAEYRCRHGTPPNSGDAL